MNQANQVAPVGSVVECADRRWLVMGYRSEKQSEHYCMCYIAAPYPSGFCGADQVKLLPVSESTVLQPGCEDAASEAVTDYVGKLAELYPSVSAEEMDRALKALEQSDLKGVWNHG